MATPDPTKSAAPVETTAVSPTSIYGTAELPEYILTNGSGVSHSVPITDGTDTFKIFLQPGGKPKLPKGFTVDAVYLARNPHIGQTVKK